MLLVNSARGCKLNGKNTFTHGSVKITSVESNFVYEGEQFERVDEREKPKLAATRNIFWNFKGIQRCDVEIYIYRVPHDPTRAPRINILWNRQLTNNCTKAPVDSLSVSRFSKIITTGATRRLPFVSFFRYLHCRRGLISHGLIDNCSPLN